MVRAMKQAFDPAMRTRFDKVLGVVEKRLALALEEARNQVDHKGNRGTNVEVAMRSVLSEHLPRVFDVGEGEVYDAYGDGTGQLDVIVTGPDHPFRYSEGAPGPYLVDGVSAVGEVKSLLTTGELDKVIASASKVKRLQLSPQKGDRITNHSKEYQRETEGVPPYFLVAFENNIADDTLMERLATAPLVPAPEGKYFNVTQHPIDAVFILGKAALLNLRSGNGPLQYQQADGTFMQGWLRVHTTNALSFMLAWLHEAMPRVQRNNTPLTPYLFPFDVHKEYLAKNHGYRIPRVSSVDDAL